MRDLREPGVGIQGMWKDVDNFAAWNVEGCG